MPSRHMHRPVLMTANGISNGDMAQAIMVCCGISAMWKHVMRLWHAWHDCLPVENKKMPVIANGELALQYKHTCVSFHAIRYIILSARVNDSGSLTTSRASIDTAISVIGEATHTLILQRGYHARYRFKSDGRVWKCSAKLAILTQPFNIIQCNIYQNVANLLYIAFIVFLYLKSLYWSIFKSLKNIIFSWYFEKLRKIRLSMSSWFFTKVTRNWLSQDPATWKSLFYFSTFG